MPLDQLFSGANFASTVQSYCNAIGWKVAELSSQNAVLRFNMDSGRQQMLFIIRYDTTLEFSVPSLAAFDSEQNIPHLLSTLLLQRNAERKVGFWCLEKIKGKHVFSCMHNAEIRLLDQGYFKTVVESLVLECDHFEDILIRMMR